MIIIMALITLDFYSASSLKQQSADRHDTPLGHIIPILSQPVFALSNKQIKINYCRDVNKYSLGYSS
jgi:hypothetical protein